MSLKETTGADRRAEFEREIFAKACLLLDVEQGGTMSEITSRRLAAHVITTDHDALEALVSQCLRHTDHEDAQLVVRGVWHRTAVAFFTRLDSRP